MKLVNSRGKTILNFKAPFWKFLGKVLTAIIFLGTIVAWYIAGFIISGV